MYDAVYQVERVAKRHEEPTIRSGAVPMLEHGGPLPVLSAPGAPLMSEDLEEVTICGRSCETDNLFADVQVPSDIGPGDLVQVLSTGAYNASMASNYNRFPRPATVMIMNDGQARLVQKRESYEQMFEREVSLE
jgi:diaminopimelate decarboxylase